MVGPSATALQRTVGASCTATWRVRASSPALATLWAPRLGHGCQADRSTMFTTAPPPRSSMDGATALIRWNGACSTTSKVWYQVAVSSEGNSSRANHDALLTTASIGPRRPATASASLAASPGAARSTRNASASTPWPRSSSTVLAAWSCDRWYAIATSAPAAASASAIARPTRWAPPVTSATRPGSSIGYSMAERSCRGRGRRALWPGIARHGCEPPWTLVSRSRSARPVALLSAPWFSWPAW